MGFHVLFLNVLITLLIHKISSSSDWNYGRFGPEVWVKKYKECGGHHQSPVNIQTACTIQREYEPFHFSSRHTRELNFTLFNDGHTIVARYNGPKLIVNGGNLDGDYEFVNFHLHWGPNENAGSEHQINGIRYTGESHFVYKNMKTGKLAVLGFLMKNAANSTDNNDEEQNDDTRVRTSAQWQKYFDAAQKLLKKNQSLTIRLKLSLLMGDKLNDFWRYTGSLTVPPCTEDVTWTVFKEALDISNYDLDSFRDDIFFESSRAPQPLYHRKIYRSFEYEIPSSIPDQKCCKN